MNVLRAQDYKRMPWKNGGGETVEIAVFPPNASVNDFDWRISMATVASDGPFSIFPGIDRTLSIPCHALRPESDNGGKMARADHDGRCAGGL